MQSWQAALAVFATVLIATSSCDSDYDVDCEGEEALHLIDANEGCSYYYDLLENALLNDSNNVYSLQQAFFPPIGETQTYVNIWVGITIGSGILNNSCSDVTSDESGSQTYVDGEYSGIFYWIPSRVDEFTLGNIFFEPVISHGIDLSSEYQDWGFVDIYLKLESLRCNPRRDTTYYTLARLITWAKAYARARGKPRTLDERDQGQIVRDKYMYILDDDNTFRYSKAIHRLLLAGFVFLNVLVMLLMVTFIPRYYHILCRKVNSDVNSNIYLSFYWGCALVFFILSMALFLLDLMVYVALCYLFEMCSTELAIGYLVTCISTRFVVTVVELIVCAIVCKRNTITVPIPFQKCTTNVLFCCCCCCCCTSTLKSKVGQTLALWGIVVFVQHITASLFPVCFAIISRPAEILSVLALIASTVFCIIMFVVHLLHQGRVAGCQQTAAFCMRVFAIVLFLGLAVTLLTLYLMFLAAGVEFSFGSFLGSLIPSVILSAVGWYVKTKFLNTKSIEDPISIELTQPIAPNPTTKPDQHGTTRGDSILETAVFHRNVPELESDEKRTPLLCEYKVNMN